MPSSVSTVAKQTTFLGGPFLAAAFPFSSHTLASSLKAAHHPTSSCRSPQSRRKNQKVPCGMHLGLPFPLIRVRGDWVHEAAHGNEEGERFSSKFQSQEDALSTVDVSKSGQYIITELLEYHAGAFWTTFLHMASTYTESHSDLWRPGYHPGHCR